jgi:serine/threonine protein kinase
LASDDIQFKAPSSLHELIGINAGLRHGYSQVGKCITVYPRTTEEALFLAEELHALTYGMTAPAVPFDLRLQPDSNVYYRYGAFRRLSLEHPDGGSTLAMRDPQGKLVPDLRTNASAKPDWASNPFLNSFPQPALEPMESPLKTTYRAFRALTQRGKGGVYQAVDLSQRPPRLCVLKEGRRYGELGWDGRDGCWRVRHEEQTLQRLRASGLAPPQVYASFTAEGNYYLVTEFIAGESIQGLLKRRRRRLAVAQALRYGSQMAEILFGIHSAGWVWRDCKPSNFILTHQGVLRPIDFEGACPVDSPDPLPWSTPAFAAPAERADDEARSSLYDDLYSLGAVIYLLLTGRLPEPASLIPLQKLRRGVPAEALELITTLLTASPRQRPNAQLVFQRLQAACAGLRSAGD